MPPHYRAVFTGDYKNVPLARSAVASFARLCGFNDDEVSDIRLAAGEALSNAVEHGRLGARMNGFSVKCIYREQELEIEVRDNGEGFTFENTSRTPLEERTRGFGLFLMRRLMDRVYFDNNGSTVRLMRRREYSA